MAARMSYIGVKAVVVNGRVRDLAELNASGLHVSSSTPEMLLCPKQTSCNKIRYGQKQRLR